MLRMQASDYIKLLFGLAVAACAYGLKSLYSRGNSENMRWVLEPTAWMVEFLSGIPFTYESGLGWINHLHQVAIVPSCSGGNFFIILFCMSSFQILYKADSARYISGMIAVASLLAYGVTVFVNSLRIWISIGLYRADIYSGWVTPEQVHRIAGVCVYYFFLFLYYLLVSFILKENATNGKGAEVVSSRAKKELVLLLPLFWYLLFTLGIPYINNGYRTHREQFVRHTLTVIGVSFLCTLIFQLSRQLLCRDVTYKPPEKTEYKVIKWLNQES